jgi:hypothetical protein
MGWGGAQLVPVGLHGVRDGKTSRLNLIATSGFCKHSVCVCDLGMPQQGDCAASRLALAGHSHKKPYAYVTVCRISKGTRHCVTSIVVFADTCAKLCCVLGCPAQQPAWQGASGVCRPTGGSGRFDIQRRYCKIRWPWELLDMTLLFSSQQA